MSSLLHRRIASLTAKTLWLAPLAGVTDSVFRSICKTWGADVVVSEMISADGLVYSYNKSIEYARFTADQRPFGMQLFGSESSMMRQGAQLLLAQKPDFLDVNMGCPVKKVIKRGAGSALMQTPQRAMEIVSALEPVVHEMALPLSVKFRAGWDGNSINAVEFACQMEAAGADILCLHPRTRSQMFGGKSDWQLITEVKKAVSIPVIGNGDIASVADALEMFETTGCDGVMIGRAAWGNPWLFAEIKAAMQGEEIPEISYGERFKTVRNHFLTAFQHYPRKRAVHEMRTHFARYSRGLRGGASFRAKINSSDKPEEVLHFIEELYNEQA